jgi:hypothetical protein
MAAATRNTKEGNNLTMSGVFQDTGCFLGTTHKDTSVSFVAQERLELLLGVEGCLVCCDLDLA